MRAKRPVDEHAIAEHVAQMEAEERAYRLREIREEQGVTQKELADRMALTQPAISALEVNVLQNPPQPVPHRPPAI